MTFREKLYDLWIHLAVFSPIKKFFLRSRGAFILEKLIGDKESILDIGCGVGQFVHHFSRRANHVIGIDVHFKSIVAAKRHFKEDVFLVTDATTLPFKQKSFDTIILSYSLHHIHSNILSQCRKIARKRIIVIEMKNHPLLNLINFFWDKLLPYPIYYHDLPLPDSTLTSGTNDFSIFLI